MTLLIVMIIFCLSLLVLIFSRKAFDKNKKTIEDNLTVIGQNNSLFWCAIEEMWKTKWHWGFFSLLFLLLSLIIVSNFFNR